MQSKDCTYHQLKTHNYTYIYMQVRLDVHAWNPMCFGAKLGTSFERSDQIYIFLSYVMENCHTDMANMKLEQGGK